MSHITYLAAFHKWKTNEKEKLESVIRRAYKTAIGIPESMSTERLLSLGVHNTLDEVMDAQRVAQLERLSITKTGRRLLNKLGYNYHEQQGTKTQLRDDTRDKIQVDAVPRNMHPEYNEGRRQARAKALAELHAGDAGARYVDAAEYQNERGFVVTLVDAEGNPERRPASRAADPRKQRRWRSCWPSKIPAAQRS